jgi:hypothetical protein
VCYKYSFCVEVLELLRASLTPGSVLNEVFGKRVNNRNLYVLAPLREILSHSDAISSMSYELLRSIERGKRLKGVAEQGRTGWHRPPTSTLH